ncbi:Fbox domain containing protein [Acanthamoeba castellanii str. Neff]|uniref:Fbox domain containing protein n=1 Tax=Acanthamoeba castellanii (strain ATCC 30010 / Neff) TaxID=1257118 RepID=L8HBL8_ACACF|nr:Fbox domain containing protein [Acanthamoeba castellanii str. Neff]ELR21806.1 Fbox domain containing protein [Acanthamoeba castellanii str. Neff]
MDEDAHLTRLPAELLFHICQLLPLADLSRMSGVCRSLRVVANADSLWRQRYLQRYYHPTAGGSQRTTSWKQRFKRNRTLERRWRNGSHTSHSVKGSHDDTTWCVSVGATLAATGAQGLTALCTVQSGQIGIWDVKRRKWRKTLMGHTSFVRAVKVLQDDCRLLSGGGDCVIQVWNLEAEKASEHSVARFLTGQSSKIITAWSRALTTANYEYLGDWMGLCAIGTGRDNSRPLFLLVPGVVHFLLLSLIFTKLTSSW